MYRRKGGRKKGIGHSYYEEDRKQEEGEGSKGINKIKGGIQEGMGHFIKYHV